MNHAGDITAVAGVAQDTHAGQKAQHAGHSLAGAGLVDPVRGAGVHGECAGVPELPVVIQGGGVVGLGRADHHIGQAE